MSANNQLFLAWEERVISQEKGNRLVHFYLKHFSGDYVLAVVGTERSVRHMIYVVSEDLLNAYGSMIIAKPGMKWRARRDVVEWLTEAVSKYRQPNSQTTGLVESLRSSEFSVPSFGTHLTEQTAPRKLKGLISDIVWSGDAWICCEQLKHYPAFCRSGVTIPVFSFVYIMGKQETRYLSYLEDLYEDKKGQKQIRVRWFLHSHEVKDLIPKLDMRPGEVFITPHEQVVSLECVDSVALVLTPKDYERYVSLHPQSSLFGVHMCHREFKNNKVKLFSLSKLRGYDNQPVISQHSSLIEKSNEEVEDCDDKGLEKQGVKKPKSFKGSRKSGNGQSVFTNSVPGNQIANCEPTHQKLKIKFSSRGAVGIKVVGPEPQCQTYSNVGDNVELLCQDSGMRGCWFRCKILRASQKRLKVQYYDVQDVDGFGKLEEWVPSTRVAAPDKLGMRHAGRLTLRPWPPEDSSERAVQIGTAVDAWWCDGWWEGVVIGNRISGSQVYFPGENKILTFKRKSLRISRDWIDNKWVDIKPKHDIHSCASSILRAQMKLPTSSRSSEASGSALEDCKVVASPKPMAFEDDKQSMNSPTSDGIQGVGELDLKKQLSIQDDEDKFTGGSAGSSSEVSGVGISQPPSIRK